MYGCNIRMFSTTFATHSSCVESKYSINPPTCNKIPVAQCKVKRGDYSTPAPGVTAFSILAQHTRSKYRACLVHGGEIKHMKL